MEKINNSNSLMSNNEITSTNSSKFVLSKDQLDQLSGQLKLLSIDDVDIKKVLKKLKTLKNEQLSLANQTLNGSNGLFEFILSQILNCGSERVLSIDLGNNNSSFQTSKLIFRFNLCRTPYPIPDIKYFKNTKVADQNNFNFRQTYLLNNQKIILKVLDNKKLTSKQIDNVLEQIKFSNQFMFNDNNFQVNGGSGYNENGFYNQQNNI
uniref:Uncharacterized protein n=2 Tax=Meloidogyne hapla TaxID=6305 RepID=A0A1I8BTS1_MELHA